MKKIKAIFTEQKVLLENTEAARGLYNKSRFGTLQSNGSVQLALIEGFYLIEKSKIEVYDGRNNLYEPERFIKKAKKIEPNFWIRYSVFKNLRDRGYIVKTALKFGGDFRVYDRGIKPGEDHAKWIVFCVHEGSTLTWYDFAAKNRVAHSTKKRLLIAIVDDEGDVTYYEIAWKRL
jgi:tRNA-intron endonuclease